MPEDRAIWPPAQAVRIGSDHRTRTPVQTGLKTPEVDGARGDFSTIMLSDTVRPTQGHLKPLGEVELCNRRRTPMLPNTLLSLSAVQAPFQFAG